MSDLLVDGYIRNIQNIISKIIPYPINKLCLQFYYTSKKIIAWSGNCTELYVADFDCTLQNITLHQNWKCNVYSMDNINIKISKTDYPNWDAYEPGLCYNAEVKFPTSVSNKIAKAFHKLNPLLNQTDHYETIFKCGGSRTKHCHAMIIHPLQFYDIKQNEVIALNMELPLFAVPKGTNGLVFSQTYGLISLGGERSSGSATSSVSRLPINDIDNYNKYKWVELNNMQYARIAPSTIMIDDHKLIVLGGYNDDGYSDDDELGESYTNSVEMYDFESGEWSDLASMNINRSDAVCCFDANLNKLYVAGSDNKTKSKVVDEYDMHKNVWSLDNIPNTTYAHGARYYLTLWMEDVNILAITSSVANEIQVLDLRENVKSWNTITSENHCSNAMSVLYGESFPKTNRSTWNLLSS